MNWFWLNIPLGAVFFLAVAAIPLWMVIRHPDSRPARTGATGGRATAQARAVAVARTTDWLTVPAETGDRRELAGASAGDRG
jgi:hypothetical protein